MLFATIHLEDFTTTFPFGRLLIMVGTFGSIIIPFGNRFLPLRTSSNNSASRLKFGVFQGRRFLGAVLDSLCMFMNTMSFIM